MYIYLFICLYICALSRTEEIRYAINKTRTEVFHSVFVNNFKLKISQHFLAACLL